MGYVALSRVRSLSGLMLIGLNETALQVHPDVLAYDQKLRALSEEAALAVGRDVIAELQSHGLRTDWDGTWGQRIKIELDWKRRR